MPVNINLLPDEVIARGVTPPNVSSLFDSYSAGQDYAQKQALQNLFAGGIPRDANGDFDYRKMADMLARTAGAAAIPTLTGLRTGDIQQQALRGLEQGGGQLFDQAPPAQPRVQLPPSTGRPPAQSQSYLEPDQGGDRTLRPDQPGNIGGDVIAQTVDGQPTEVPAARSFAPVASTDSRYPPEFGPAPERFTQVAQAQTPPPPPSASPIPPGQPGYFSEENAARLDAIANRANYVAQTFDVGGLKAEGLLQQAKQAADRAKQIREQMSKISEEREKSRLKVEAATPEEVAKQSVSRLSDSRKRAEIAAEGVPASQNLLDQLNTDPGVFSGKYADKRLALAKIGQLFGIQDDRTIPTEAFSALVGRRVATTVKAFGSGTSITNQDREYATKMEGGDISLEEGSIRRIITLGDKVARETIKMHDRDVNTMQKAYPQANLTPFRVDMPEPLQGRTTQPKPGPQGAIPPAPAPQQRQQDQIYMTPKGPAHWRGTGWELVR